MFGRLWIKNSDFKRNTKIKKENMLPNCNLFTRKNMNGECSVKQLQIYLFKDIILGLFSYIS